MRRVIDVTILIIVVIGGFFAVTHAQDIGDLIHAKRYSPDSEIVKLAEDSGMNNKGMKLFYRFSPQLMAKSELDKLCTTDKLGCTEGSSIYILQSENDVEQNRNIVTAAHEMLHVAYSRLKQSEKDSLEILLKAELDKSGADKINEKLKGYPEKDFYNEAHSFVGSELPNISPELEEYYKQYFSDRGKSTASYFESTK